MTAKATKAAISARPAPVSLHPLTTEQALGALLRVPAAGATGKPPPKKIKPKAKRKAR